MIYVLYLAMSRRDDLESIGYMIIQFLLGSLPWQGIGGVNKIEKYSNILEVKMQTVEEILCRDIHCKKADLLNRLILQVFEVFKGAIV